MRKVRALPPDGVQRLTAWPRQRPCRATAACVGALQSLQNQVPSLYSSQVGQKSEPYVYGFEHLKQFRPDDLSS